MLKKMVTRKSVLVGLTIMHAPLALAFDFGGAVGRIDGSSLQSHTPLSLTTLSSPQWSGGNDFALGLVSNVEAMTRMASDFGMHPYLRLVQTSQSSTPSLGLAGNGEISTTEYAFHAGDFPICGNSLRSISIPSGVSWAVGNIPAVDRVDQFDEKDWPLVADASSRAISEISSSQNHNPAGAVVTKSSRCLYNNQGTLEPAWNIIIRVDGLTYGAYANASQVFEASPRFFDAATATVRAYDPNEVTGTLKDFTINVAGDGTLTNDYFTTQDFTGTVGRATATDNKFVYAPTDQKFAEASCFAHVNQHLDFLVGKGYSWVGPKPLTVVIHATIKGTTNNALYTPFDGTSGPFIRVGDGDGQGLQKLATDGDVVSHELGHHVIYQALTTVSGESLILHEGLADFMAFSRSGDACLGESICPASSTMCAVPKTCLRSADNKLTYNGTDYNNYGTKYHLKGQLISGFLWDLRKSNAIPADDLSRMIVSGVVFLKSDAAIPDFVLAILNADKALFSSKYQAAILSALDARGMGIATVGVSLTSVDGLPPSKAAASSSDSSSKSGGILGMGGCSTLGVSGQSGQDILMIIILLGIPVFFATRPKAQAVPVRSKKR